MKDPKHVGRPGTHIIVHRKGGKTYRYLRHAEMQCQLDFDDERDSPEFAAKIEVLKQWLEGEATARKTEVPVTVARGEPKNFGQLLDRFYLDDAWRAMRPATHRTWAFYLEHARKRWENVPVAFFDDHRAAKPEFKAWLAEIAKGQRGDGQLHPVAANAGRRALLRLINFAVENDWIESGVNKLYSVVPYDETDVPRQNKIWTPHEQEFLSKTTPTFRAVYLVGLMTGARRFDLARFGRDMITPTGYLTFAPHKTEKETNVEVALPLGELPPLGELVDDLLRGHNHDRILLNSLREPWKNERSLGQAFAQEVTRIFGKDFDRTLHDLRRTCMARLRSAGVDDAEIAAVVGHTFKNQIGTYIGDRPALARSAYRKWAHAIEQGKDPLSPTWTPEIIPLRTPRAGLSLQGGTSGNASGNGKNRG